ncbi:MAG: PilZ domain-containing protein [Pseudobdellovibrionaceae bacterium]
MREDTVTKTPILDLFVQDDRQVELLKSFQEKRLRPRYLQTLEVVLVTSHHSYRTKTVNLSESGMLLCETVPKEFARGVIDVILVLHPYGQPPERLWFEATMIGGSLPTARLMFLTAKNQSDQKLRDFIKN